MKTKRMEMTNEHRDGLKSIMEWYWRVGNARNLISKEDYEFLYKLWNNGVTTYDDKMQVRLNKIREIYTDKEQWI
tara:strand:+ start:396 stop:620 length:225 start_codon:yes stop_codon:yes gene_type:complete